jgi:hypothetical protein
MEPEYTAFKDNAHSRVGCAECHISPGASGFVTAKLSGTRQLVGVVLGNYARPVPAPVHNLAPTDGTCEQCHWPEKNHGDLTKVIREYAADEKNTESTTTLAVHVGGGGHNLALSSGIHWHMNVANVVEYIATDDKRQVIPWIKVTDRSGNSREYVADGVTPEALAKGERRKMDCSDCHNRAGHLFDASADKAVNRALATGMIPTSLPFVKREATAALGETYASLQVADEKIAQRLNDFYKTNYNDFYMGKRADVDRAVTAAQQLYRRNIFPAMSITWGTYPNNLGHMDFPGCFRCHDESHKSKDGKVVGQDCALCHDMK